MHRAIDEGLATFVAEERLPRSYIDTARRWFVPLADEVAAAIGDHELKILGVVGAQGSGKSTLASLLAMLLDRMHGLRTISLSLDDFYLTRAQRQRLAEEVHPLLITRGVPGTHDLPLAMGTLDALLSRSGEATIPRFDKSRDERKPEPEWRRVAAPVDAVILEGWCLKAEPQTSAELSAPINALEAHEDGDGRWRGYVNHCLATDYPPLFSLIDRTVLLKVPNFDCVYTWRRQQEQKLAATSRGDQIMSDPQLRRFIQHFERVTRHSLATLPNKADLVFELDARQHVIERYDNSSND